MIPEYLEHALQTRHAPVENRMSVTRLIGPPLINTLEAKHWQEITETVDDKLWALDGIGFDAIMKEYSRWGLTNIKLEILFGDITVVGRPDYYNVLTYILADLKRTSVYTIKSALRKAKKDWVHQLNIYDYLLKRAAPNLRIDGLEVHAFARDWRPMEALKEGPRYPRRSEIIPIPRWSTKDQMDYIDSQL